MTEFKDIITIQVLPLKLPDIILGQVERKSFFKYLTKYAI